MNERRCLNTQMFQWLKDELGDIKKDIKEVNGKVNDIVEMKAKLMGMAAVVSLVLTFLLQIAFQVIQKKIGGFL